MVRPQESRDIMSCLFALMLQARLVGIRSRTQHASVYPVNAYGGCFAKDTRLGVIVS